jgi:hypothetical protein
VAAEKEPSGGERAVKSSSAAAATNDSGEDHKNLARRLRALGDATEALGGAEPASHRQQFTAAMGSLAAALEGLTAGQQEPEVQLAKQAAQTLDKSEGAAVPLDVLTEGLSAALQLLVKRAPPEQRAVEYQRSVETLAQGVDALKPTRALSEQRSYAVQAFRAATDAVFLAAEAEPPFGIAEAASSDGAERSSAADLERARMDVLKLGQTSWTSALTASSQALLSIAETLESLAGRERAREEIARVRLLAERLRRSDAQGFGHSKSIKEALDASLDALQQLRLIPEQILDSWTRAARAATSGIDERKSMAFQRAALQDAFRATLDALAFAAQASAWGNSKGNITR